MLKTLSGFYYLMRLDKPIGALLLLWPTLWALWLASAGWPSFKLLAIFSCGVVIMRSAGCVVNDLADRHFDGHVARTCQRPLVTGAVSHHQALGLFMGLCLIALLLVLQLNGPTILLAVIGLALTLIYPFMKRYTHWPQLVLGAAFAWGVPMAFMAVNKTIPGYGWLLYVIAIIWPLAYDTLYAMVDQADDVKIGIKSTAIFFAPHQRLIIGILQALMLSLMAYLGYALNLNQFFYLSLLIAVALMGYQQYLIRHLDPAACFKAFLNNHWVGLVIFIGILLNYS